jgi:hypothetical protein
MGAASRFKNPGSVIAAVLAGTLLVASQAGAENYYFRIKSSVLSTHKSNLAVSVSGSEEALVGSPISARIEVTSGTGPYAFAVREGGLPPGVALESTNGSITGSPTAAGDFTATIAVNDSFGASGAAVYKARVGTPLSISGLPVTQVSYGGAYNSAFSAAGGDGNYTWSITGALPTGINFSNGRLSGTAQSFGTYSGIVVTVHDGKGTQAQSAAFSIAVADVIASVTANRANLNLQSLFSGTDWSSNAPKRVILKSGAVVYSSSVGSPALSSGTTWGGTLTLEIESGGEVQGAGGLGSSTGVGNNGGDAILVQQVGLVVINNGAIRGGGGGGGKGGIGAEGQTASSRTPATGYNNSVTSPLYGCYRRNGQTQLYWINSNPLITVSGSPSSINYGGSTYTCGSNSKNDSVGYPMYEVFRTDPPVRTAGGSGGAGGNGQGANQTATSGAVGANGETLAGRGGNGGSGGSWGSLGGTGQVGLDSNIFSGSQGYAGGVAGYAIRGTVTYGGSGIKQGQ